MKNKEVVCLCCGAYSVQLCDLEMTGSALDHAPIGKDLEVVYHWIQRCPDCGFCSPDISTMPTTVAVETLPAKVYHPGYVRGLEEFLPEAVRRFQSWMGIAADYLLYQQAGWSALRAAWICEAENLNTHAFVFRRLAVDYFVQVLAGKNHLLSDPNLDQVILSDIFRRLGLFDAALDKLSTLLRSGKSFYPLLRARILYGRDLCMAKDSKQHTIDEAAAFYRRQK